MKKFGGHGYRGRLLGGPEGSGTEMVGAGILGGNGGTQTVIGGGQEISGFGRMFHLFIGLGGCPPGSVWLRYMGRIPILTIWIDMWMCAYVF